MYYRMGKDIVDHYGELIQTGFYRSINNPENVSYIDLDKSRIIQPKGAYSLDSIACSILVPLDVKSFVQKYKEIIRFIHRIEHNKANLSVGEKSYLKTIKDKIQPGQASPL